MTGDPLPFSTYSKLEPLIEIAGILIYLKYFQCTYSIPSLADSVVNGGCQYRLTIIEENTDFSKKNNSVIRGCTA
jgi:hypothetical protein